MIIYNTSIKKGVITMYKYNGDISLNIDTVLRRNRNVQGHNMGELRVQFKINNKDDYRVIKKWFKKNDPNNGALVKDGFCCLNPQCGDASYELLYYYFTPHYEVGLKGEIFKCLDEIFDTR